MRTRPGLTVQGGRIIGLTGGSSVPGGSPVEPIVAPNRLNW